MVSQVDLFPTICDLLGIPNPEWTVGKSLHPILQNESTEIRDELFTQVNYHAAYEPKRAIRTDTHKLIVNFDDAHDDSPMGNVDPGLTKTKLVQHGFSELIRPRLELYDLMLDPAEKNNLADDPEHRETLDRLKARLEEWQRETDDPILKGPILAPEGATISPH